MRLVTIFSICALISTTGCTVDSDDGLNTGGSGQFSSVDFDRGEWEFGYEFEGLEGSGTFTITTCLADPVFAGGFAGDVQGEFEFENDVCSIDYGVNGSRITGNWQCNFDGTQTNADIDFTWSGSTMEGHITMSSSDQDGDVTLIYTGRRIGDC